MYQAKVQLPHVTDMQHTWPIAFTGLSITQAYNEWTKNFSYAN